MHGLITLIAVLYLVATPALYYALHKVHQVGFEGRRVALRRGYGNLTLSDLLLIVSSIVALDHAIAHVAGNLLSPSGVLVAGALMLKGVFTGGLHT